MSSSHEEECPKYPVECPNHCETGRVRREEMSGHLEECPLAIVKCPYAAVGCDSVVRRKEKMEHVTESIGQHMEYNKNTILDTQNELARLKSTMNDRLDSVKKDFQSRLDAKERELENLKQDLQNTRDTLTKCQEVQSHLKTTLVEKGRELDELRKNTTENNKILQELIQQLKVRQEGSEQSLQQQLKVAKHSITD